MRGGAKEKLEIANEKEVVEESTVQAMGKNKYGNIEKNELQESLDNQTNGRKAEVKEIRKKLVVEFIDSQRMYYVDKEGNIYEYIYKELPIMEEGIIFYKRMQEYRAKILKIKVVDYVEIPNEAVNSFDVSLEQNKSVMAWFMQNEDNNECYDLYIGGDGGVQASSSCQNMFASMGVCLSIDLEHFYTDNTINFGYMFQGDAKVTSINLSNFDTSKAENMNSMFATCNSLSEMNVSNFNTSNVLDMAAMFAKTNIKTIDLSNFDTSNVKSMNGMFEHCSQLEELDLSNFNTSSLIRTDYMFYGNRKLQTIYVSDKWNNEKVTESTKMFGICISISGSIKFDSTKIDITYANYENGYFTYKDK